MTQQQATTINQLSKEEARWFAVYTNYKREKLVRKMLELKGIECYLPIKKVVKQWSKKRRTMEIPLISCYIFVRIVEPEYVPVLETEHVLKFVRIGKDLLAIPDEEIDVIRRILQDKIDFEVDTAKRFQAGDTVEITGGSLTGMRGKLVEVEGKKRVVITLEHIQHAFQLSVETHLIKKVQA